MASIVQRGYKWQAKIRTQGQPIRSKTFDTREAAEQWAAEQAAIKPAPKQPRKVHEKPPMLTVGDLFARYIKAPLPGRRNVEWERGICRHFIRNEKKLCAVPAAKLDKPHLVEWRDRRIGEVAPSTVIRELDAISAVYRLAIDEWARGSDRQPDQGTTPAQAPAAP